MADEKKTGTASVAIKAQYHLYCSKGGKPMSLKEFARNLLKTKDPVAVEWLDHKHGSLERKAKALRLKNKGKQLADIRVAMRTSRSKTASNKSAKSKTTPTPAK